MYSPFEPTKFVFLSNVISSISFLDTNIHYYFFNNTTFLTIIYLFICVLFFFTITNFKSTTIELLFGIYQFIYDLVESYLGEGYNDKHISDKVFPFLFYLFLFLLLNNIIGLLPFQLALTSHLSTTFSCSLFI